MTQWLPQLGDVLAGRYQVDAVLGEGGFGVVFRAVHLGLDRPVAIKMLLPHALSDRMAVVRFQREIDLARRLRHPNTVQILDRGETEHGLQYYAMELLEGRTLGDELAAAGPLPWPRVRTIVEQVLGSLGEAHGLGIVHRDLKPGNVMLVDVFGRTDFVKVLDFGIGKAFGDGAAAHSLATRGVIGTPHYMSPEQALARPDVDGRSDLYSLGIVMMEILGGRRPYEGPSAVEILMRHAAPDPVPIPPALAGGPLGPVLVKALQKDSGRRFAGAAEMLAVLQAVPDEAETARRTATSLEPVPPTAKLRPSGPLAQAPPATPPAAPPAIIIPPAANGGAGTRSMDPRMRTVTMPRDPDGTSGAEAGRTALRRRAVTVWAVGLVLAGATVAILLGTRGASDAPAAPGGTGGAERESGDEGSAAESPSVAAAAESTPEPERTCQEQGLAARPDGVHWFRTFSTWVAPGRLWLGDPIDAEAAPGAMAYAARFENGRPVEVTPHSPRGQPGSALVPAWDSSGRLTGWVERDRYGYEERRSVVRWTGDGQVELQRQTRAQTWDGSFCPWLRFRLDDAGQVEEIECRDLDGTLVERQCSPARQVAESHDACGFVTAWSFRDPAGNPTELRCYSSAASWEPEFFGGNAWPDEAPGCHTLQLDPGPFGWLRRRACLGPDGLPQAESPRPIEDFEHDARGALVRWRVLDAAGQAVDPATTGYYDETLTYDAHGEAIQTCQQGCRIPRVWCDPGCLRVEWDDSGRLVATARFDLAGAPVAPQGAHRVEFEPDMSFFTRQRVFDVDRQPMLSNLLGIESHEVRCERNALGRPTECLLFGLDGQPTAEGHRMTRRYDDRGNRIQQCLYDADGRPVAWFGDASCIEEEYDAANRRTQVTAWSEGNSEPVVDNRSEYDAAGRRIAHSVGTPYENWVARIEYTFDGLARETSAVYRDRDGNRISVAYTAPPGSELSSEHAGWQATYDLADRPIRLCLLDTSGSVAPAEEGEPACVARQYGPDGTLLALTFWASDDTPALATIGEQRAHEVRIVRRPGSSEPAQLRLLNGDDPEEELDCSAEVDCAQLVSKWARLPSGRS